MDRQDEEKCGMTTSHGFETEKEDAAWREKVTKQAEREYLREMAKFLLVVLMGLFVIFAAPLGFALFMCKGGF